MSGGAYDYAYERVNDFLFHFTRNATTPQRKAFQQLLKHVGAAMHAIEWADSGDTGEDTVNKAIEECFPPAQYNEALLHAMMAGLRFEAEQIVKLCKDRRM